MRFIFLIAVAALLFGCAHQPPVEPQQFNEELLTTAQRVNDVTGVLMRATGPLAVAGVCATQPQDCAAAKAAYPMALAAQEEYAKVLADMLAVNAAPDGLKLAAAAENFAVRFAEINSLIVKSGGVDHSSAIADLIIDAHQMRAAAP